MSQLGGARIKSFDLVEREISADCREVAVIGERDLAVADRLSAVLDRAAGEAPQILISLDKCEFIDSTGIALIVRTWQRLDGGADGEREGRIVLCCVNHQVRRLLKITGVEASISMHERPDAALAELQAASS